ncbi:hypothetical protein [uncultured Enterococcus sp.]|uniref:hypothetical protein n=1 Tax=uncultured Enterococcus sp. TaxID=167972 RepID=UPI002AA6B4E8|nr:hypothetical protein [uncultured Enterococcus sp.]
MKEQVILEKAIRRLKDLQAKKEMGKVGDPYIEFQILSETIDQLNQFYNINTVDVSSEDVRRLRDQTGISLSDAESVLKQQQGDYEKAIEIVRSRGFA